MSHKMTQDWFPRQQDLWQLHPHGEGLLCFTGSTTCCRRFVVVVVMPLARSRTICVLARSHQPKGFPAILLHASSVYYCFFSLSSSCESPAPISNGSEFVHGRLGNLNTTRFTGAIRRRNRHRNKTHKNKTLHMVSIYRCIGCCKPTKVSGVFVLPLHPSRRIHCVNQTGVETRK